MTRQCSGCHRLSKPTKEGDVAALVQVSKEEFDRFRTDARDNNWGWPAALSTNHWREIWPPTGWGYTPLEDRRRLRGRFPFLGEIVDAYLEMQPQSGRFFVDEELAYYKPDEDGDPRYPIAILRIGN
jgi:hypothetical protein